MRLTVEVRDDDPAAEADRLGVKSFFGADKGQSYKRVSLISEGGAVVRFTFVTLLPHMTPEFRAQHISKTIESLFFEQLLVN